MVSVSDILVAFSDEESLSLFSSIAIQPIDADTLRNKISLTRKQYYSRMHRLTKSNLIKKNEGKYFLTMLGIIVHNAICVIEESLKYYWQLRAIDSLQNSDQLPQEERKRIIDSLINTQKIKEILSRSQLGIDVTV